MNSVRDPLLLLRVWTVFRDPILLRGTVFRETMNSDKGDVASPVNVLVYSRKDIGRFSTPLVLN
jgi:hypothetical protein